MKLRVECYDNSRPIIKIGNRFSYYSESDTEEDDTRDVDYVPNEEEEEEEEESEYDPDEEQVSDSEDGSDYESETEPEENEEDEVREPKPYYGKGYTIVFDSVEDKREYFKNLNKTR